MALYRQHSRERATIVPISLADLLRPGSFEYMLNYLFDSEIDLSVLDGWNHNRATRVPDIRSTWVTQSDPVRLFTRHYHQPMEGSGPRGERHLRGTQARLSSSLDQDRRFHHADGRADKWLVSTVRNMPRPLELTDGGSDYHTTPYAGAVIVASLPDPFWLGVSRENPTSRP